MIKHLVIFILLAFNNLSAETLLLKNATIYTGESDSALQGYDILIDNGIIVSIKEEITESADVTTNLEEKIITAGLIAPFSQMGLVEIGMIQETRDDNSDLYSAGFSITQAFNPSSTLIPYNLNGGVTSSISAPSGSGLFSGLGSSFSLSGENNSLITKDLALYASLGAGEGSKAANLLLMEDTFELARKYDPNSNELQNYSLPNSIKYSKRDLLAVKRVIDKEIPLVISADRASDILTLIRFAQEQDIELILKGASEGWMVSKQLSESDIPVILSPINNLPSSFDRLGSRLENASLLNKAGVRILISSDRWETHNAYLSRQGAGIAVAYGLPWHEALRALTLNVADIFDIPNRGSISTGNIADLVVWDSDPLEVTAFAEKVYISGKLMSTQTRSKLLKDRYLNID